MVDKIECERNTVKSVTDHAFIVHCLALVDQYQYAD